MDLKNKKVLEEDMMVFNINNWNRDNNIEN